MASRETKFLWKFFGALNIPIEGGKADSGTIDLFTDSMGVVSLSRNSVLTSATKHMEIADFYVRELVARGIITVAHVPTEFMLADVLTNPLAKIKFFRLINAIWAWRQCKTAVGLPVPSGTTAPNRSLTQPPSKRARP